MARKLRLHVPGGFYHVMLRGNGGQDIFFAKADWRSFLDRLAEGVERFGRDTASLCHAAGPHSGWPRTWISPNASKRSITQ